MILLILSLFFVYPNIFAAPIIQLSLISPSVDTAEKPLATNIQAGHIVTYGGYADVSDWDGLISLPRKQVSRSVHLLVSQFAEPVAMFHNTLSHWKLTTQKEALYYSIEQKKDEKTGQQVWHLIKKELPSDGVIPIDTIILWINPSNIKIKQDVTEALDNENLIIPPITIINGADEAQNALIFLKIRHFFNDTGTIFQKQAYRYEMTLDS